MLSSINLCAKYNIPYINILNEIEKLGDSKRDELFLDHIHPNSKGDKIIGELIGVKLNALVFAPL